ncbi:MAG: phospholipase A [Endozoicomonadaceae bacterium]|nr:phospholipase A [Endozoicomonadaceae bacterium]
MPDGLKIIGHPHSLVVAFLVAIASSNIWATDYEDCLIQAFRDTSPDTTISQLQARCQPKKPPPSAALKAAEAESDIAAASAESDSLLEQRLSQEQRTQNELFVLTPHRQNYLLPISHNNNVNYKPFKSIEGHVDHTEIKFQLSLKVPIAEGLFNGHGDLYFAYTGISWWQAYNDEISSPFRDTNHEPEAFFNFHTNYDIFGLKLSVIQAGINHQSNGRGGKLSRSWNRLFTSFIFEQENLYFSITPWWRVPEDSKDSPNDFKGDDNPDIQKYLGYGDIQMFYSMGAHKWSLMIRNNLRKDNNKGAVELGLSFPMTPKIRGYVQYFNGYGESLIDYNASVNRLSIGIILNDFL